MSVLCIKEKLCNEAALSPADTPTMRPTVVFQLIYFCFQKCCQSVAPSYNIQNKVSPLALPYQVRPPHLSILPLSFVFDFIVLLFLLFSFITLYSTLECPERPFQITLITIISTRGGMCWGDLIHRKTWRMFQEERNRS